VQYTFLIVDDDVTGVQDLLAKMKGFPEYTCVGTATAKDQGIDFILEMSPDLVFLEIDPLVKKSELSLVLITQLHQFLDRLPQFVIVTSTPKHAIDAIRAGVFDYLLKPVVEADLRKALLKFAKNHAYSHSPAVLHTAPFQVEPSPEISKEDAETAYASPEVDSTIICIKSYGDYQFIPVNDIVYLKADNNTTDFILQNGRKLTAYKTLKHYEVNLPFFFFRIHNSYIVNSHHVSRINTGKSLVYLNEGETSISFSKTFKENVDTLIKLIAPDYL
jgi:two-component system, LytTR family, response regulator